MILVSMISIQIGATLAKQLFAVFGVAGTAVLRSSFAALILLLIRRPWRGGPLSRLAISEVILYGGSLGAMSLFFYLCLERIPLGVGVAIQFIGPLGLALIMSHRSIDLLWIGLAGLGVVFLVIGESPLLPSQSTALDPKGLIFALLAAVCWAFYIVFGQRTGRQMPEGRASALGVIISALVILPFGLLHGGRDLLSPKIWPYAPTVAVLSSALPYSLEMMAMTRMPAKLFGVLMSFEPAFAALCGFALLGEKLTWQQWLSISVIVIASIGSVMTTPATISKPIEVDGVDDKDGQQEHKVNMGANARS